MLNKSKNPKEAPIELLESEEEEFEVEEIKDKRLKNGRIEYLIKWVNYKDEESTWEPIENLENSKELLEAFEKKIKTNNLKIKNNTKSIKKIIPGFNQFRLPLIKLNMNNSVENKKEIIQKENINKEESLDEKFIMKKRKIDIPEEILSLFSKNTISYKEFIDLYNNSKSNNLKKVENKKNNEVIQADSFSINSKNKKVNENIENKSDLEFPSYKYDIINILNCCKKENDIILCVTANDKETSETKIFDLYSSVVAEINPKLLINYYEAHLSFYSDDEKSQ